VVVPKSNDFRSNVDIAPILDHAARADRYLVLDPRNLDQKALNGTDPTVAGHHRNAIYFINNAFHGYFETVPFSVIRRELSSQPPLKSGLMP
jgi:hypothetical protein